jgi:hypothetical protein
MTYFGVEIGVLLLMNYCHSLMLLGQFDKARETFEEARCLAVIHPPSEKVCFSFSPLHSMMR